MRLLQLLRLSISHFPKCHLAHHSQPSTWMNVRADDVTVLLFTGKIYSGVLSEDKLFKAAYGQSFRCHAGSEFAMADELRVKLVPLQVQAFTVPVGGYGQGERAAANGDKQTNK